MKVSYHIKISLKVFLWDNNDNGDIIINNNDRDISKGHGGDKSSISGGNNDNDDENYGGGGSSNVSNGNDVGDDNDDSNDGDTKW